MHGEVWSTEDEGKRSELIEANKTTAHDTKGKIQDTYDI